MPNALILDRLASILVLGAVWWVLAQGSLASLFVGVPSILLAAIAFDRLRNRRTAGIRASLLPKFAVWFLWNSLRGGSSVAARALRPMMPLQPGFVRYRLTLEPGPARIFLLNCLSLLPGTLSANLEGDELVLHALDTNQDNFAEVREAELRVQALFGIDGDPVNE